MYDAILGHRQTYLRLYEALAARDEERAGRLYGELLEHQHNAFREQLGGLGLTFDA